MNESILPKSWYGQIITVQVIPEAAGRSFSARLLTTNDAGLLAERDKNGAAFFPWATIAAVFEPDWTMSEAEEQEAANG